MIPFAARLLSVACAALPPEAATVRPGGEVVLSEGGAVREWIELSCPRGIVRGGRAVAAALPVRPSAPGAYLVESRPSALSGADPGGRAPRVLHEIRVEGPLDGSAAILGEHVQGAGDEVALVLHAFAGEILEARWRVPSSPGGPVRLRGERGPKVRLAAELPGRYRVSAAARTARGWWGWAVFWFVVLGGADGRGLARPKASIACSPEAEAGREVVLDGSGSAADAPPGGVSYHWSQASGAPVILRAEGASARFVAVVPGRYEFALTVESAPGLRSRPARCAVAVRGEPATPAGGQRPADPLDVPVSVELHNEPVSVLLAALSQAGVAVRAAPDVSRERPLDEARVDLWAVEVPARRVLDWLGRVLEAHYVVESPGVVWFSRGADWLEREELDARTYRVDALFAGNDAGDLTALLSDAVLPATWARAGSGLGPLDAGKGTLSAVLPVSAHERLARVLSELRRPAASGPPPPREDDAARRLLAREVTARHSGWSLREAAWDLARQARVTIGFMPQGAAGGPMVTISGGRMPLSQALGLLAREGGAAGFAVEPDGLIWLCGGVRPPASSECLWTLAEVRSYDLSRLRSAHGFSGPMLVRLVRSRVHPERWSSPFVAAGWSAARERLVVIHSEEVQRAVGDLLERLLALGEKALGGDAPPAPGHSGDTRQWR